MARQQVGHDRERPEYPPGLVIATHRGPVSIVRDERGELVAAPPAGGLAPSLARALAGTGATWLACPMNDAEREVARTDAASSLVSGISLRYLCLDKDIVRDAYHKIANETLWFVLHGLSDLAKVTIDDDWWRAYRHYRRYNEAFAELICQYAVVGSTVVVNDYHLLLAGSYLRRKRPDLRTVHFSHTPFCSPDELAVLPDEVQDELLEGLSSYGAAGFHTSRWADAFSACLDARNVARPSTLFVAPLGVDAVAITAEASNPRVEQLRSENRLRFANKQVIFRNDRLEPTKNIARGFLAYQWLLEREPQLAQRTVFYARSYLSRAALPIYRACREEIERIVREVNNRYRSTGATPIVFEVDNDFDRTLAGYRDYDVLLVNPLLDGMNLVAKEAPILNERAGVEVLSVGAGAYDELASAVVPIEPLDVPGTGRALSAALAMPREDRERRAGELRRLGANRPPAQWLAETVSYARTPAPL